MAFDRNDNRTLAATVWAEARSGGVEGMSAVANVIVNRFRDSPSRFGRTVADVCTQPKQFSCWNDPKDTPFRQIERIVPNSPDAEAWQDAQNLVTLILYGNEPDPTHGATFYHTANIHALWDRDMIVSARIGPHVFFRPA
jgi:spore germination cell wall hydrolase CwlJ-like protein